jgi:ATP-dependent RNA helicase DHX29
MAKKKKTQLKPVVRGFATTSLPKKTIPTPEALFDKIMPDLLKSSPDASAIASEDGYASPDVVANKDANHNNIEEQHLQGLVDKLQEKTEKEIMRYSVTPYDPLFPNLFVGL